MNYKSFLHQYRPVGIIVDPSTNFNDDARQQEVTKYMQERFPGNYTLEEYYDSNTMSFRYRLKFDSEQDEIVFKLRHE